MQAAPCERDSFLSLGDGSQHRYAGNGGKSFLVAAQTHGPGAGHSRMARWSRTVRAGQPKVVLEMVAGFGTPQARTTALAHYEEPGKPR